MAKQKKTKFGNKDLLPEGSFDSRKAKIRISILIEGDLLEAYKEAAKLTSHGQYQTLMKEKLREGLISQKRPAFSEAEFESLKARLRPVFIEIADDEIKEHVHRRALKRA